MEGVAGSASAQALPSSARSCVFYYIRGLRSRFDATDTGTRCSASVIYEPFNILEENI